MPYLRRLVLLLALSTSILLLTGHVLHVFRPHNINEPLHPVISKAEAEKSFEYLKQYEHPPANDVPIPNPDYAARIAYGGEKPKPPTKDDVVTPPSKEDVANIIKGNMEGIKPKPKPEPEPTPEPKKPQPHQTLPLSKIAPANATAWHKDKNLWKVGDKALV